MSRLILAADDITLELLIVGLIDDVKTLDEMNCNDNTHQFIWFISTIRQSWPRNTN